jgi:hypothetical protein
MEIRIQATIECCSNADPDPKHWSPLGLKRKFSFALVLDTQVFAIMQNLLSCGFTIKISEIFRFPRKLSRNFDENFSFCENFRKNLLETNFQISPFRIFEENLSSIFVSTLVPKHYKCVIPE